MSRRRHEPARRTRQALVPLLSVGILAAGGAAAYLWKSADHEDPVLTVRYRAGAPVKGAVAKPWLEVVNTSGKTVDLSGVTLRYYYTADGATAYGANCVQTSLRCSNLTLKTGKTGSPARNADHYLQVGFTAAAGSLAPGRSSQGIGLQLYRVDHGKLDQANDRSYDAGDTTYTPSKLVTAYVRGTRVWGEEPYESSTPVPVRDGSSVSSRAPGTGPGVLFDDFDYTGPEDPALAANGWEARSGEGGPGVKDSWSRAGISFPAGQDRAGGQALQLRARTDGTAGGTQQSEFRRTEGTVLSGTLVARVRFSDEPTSGGDGGHIAESFFTISPDHASKKYSELDYEYMPNGGWGRFGPRLDTTSWRSSVLGDRVTSSRATKLGGWHTLAITSADGATSYSVDGQKLFTNGSGYVPRERMSINFSAWLIDLPFQGAPRTWDMQVDWVYYQSEKAVSTKTAEQAASALAAAGTGYVNTLPKS
ncbi:cellulose binding domain-containing protein [Streptomyces sp. NPDC002671]